MISEVFIFPSTVDVKSWLVMFGFQLSNIIPGFPRAKMYFVPPPYELSESQASENGQVSSWVGDEHLMRLQTRVLILLIDTATREPGGFWERNSEAGYKSYAEAETSEAERMPSWSFPVWPIFLPNLNDYLNCGIIICSVSTLWSLLD